MGIDEVDCVVLVIGLYLEDFILIVFNLVEFGVKDIWVKVDFDVYVCILL